MPIPIDDIVRESSQLLGEEPPPTCMHRFKDIGQRLFRKIDSLFLHNNQRIKELHNSTAKKIAAFMIPTVKTATVAIPLLLIDNVKAGATMMGLLVLSPAFAIGIKKTMIVYAKFKFKPGTETNKAFTAEELSLQEKVYLNKRFRFLGSSLRKLGWILNPVGNAAGALFLKGADLLDKRFITGRVAKRIYSWLTFAGYQCTRTFVPFFIDSALQKISHENPTLINGENIRDRHFGELIWKVFHNISHSYRGANMAPGWIVSRFASNQEVDHMKLAHESQAFEIDLVRGSAGEIIMTHGALPMVDGKGTREFFQALTENLAEDNGRMILMKIENHGLDARAIESYFSEFQAVNSTGQTVSLQEMLVDHPQETLGTIYDQGDRVLVWLVNDDTSMTGRVNDLISNIRGVDGPRNSVSEVFARVDGTADAITLSGDQKPGQYIFDFPAALMPSGEISQGMVNSRINNWLTHQLAKDPRKVGGIIATDYGATNTHELDIIIERWNHASDAGRQALRDEFKDSDYLNQNDLIKDAWAGIGLYLTTSTVDLRHAAVNPLGHLVDIPSSEREE